METGDDVWDAYDKAWRKKLPYLNKTPNQFDGTAAKAHVNIACLARFLRLSGYSNAAS